MPKQDDFSDFAEHLASIPRPHLTTHHSNSLPSTPYPRSRKLSFGARSPSRENPGRIGSPKSSHSENEPGSRSGGKAPSTAGCKYETGMAFSRRRIPYSIGGDQLERAKTVPKKFLNPAEEQKLSGNMRELYDRILPSKESDERRKIFVEKLERILNEQWSDGKIRVHVFGSSGNMLFTSDSDVDICITTPMKALERVCFLASALAEHGMERVVCVPHAKVPIVKFWDPELQLACDMNVNNTLALENTRMIRTYVEIDERVRPLAMIVKQWTKRRILNDAALGGTLSSYTWICLILNFLQTRNPPILPSLHKKPHLRGAGADGKIAEFDDDIDTLRGFGHSNSETLGELLFNFFRRYAYDLDYERNVVSVREARLISKEDKRWHLMQNNRLCVEEPFNTERNLGNTADDTSFRGIHLELRRAFDLVKEAKLTECLEQYIFPTTEERIWEKPAQKPPPVLSRSRSQSQSSRGNRGGYSNRGGRHSNHHRAGQSTRRASSAAAMNKFASPQIALQGLSGRDYLSQDQLPPYAQYERLRLHDHLFSEYQFLQAREHELRLVQAQAQLNAQLQAQGSTSSPSVPQQTSRDQSQRATTTNRQVSLTAPMHSGQYFYPFAYPQVPGTPQHSVHTQPSSPSMKPAQSDLRRSVHRSSAGDNSSANSRSHSQPARPLPMNLPVQNPAALPLSSSGFLQYQQLRQQQLYHALEMAQGRYRTGEVPMYQDLRRPLVDHNHEETVPKEYVGYWVNDSPPSHPYREDIVTPRLSAYQDAHPRVRGIPQNFSRLRNNSRSPSPSPVMPFRDRSISVLSASSAPPGPPRIERSQGPAPALRPSGPVIINGTDGWGMPDYSNMAEGSSHTTTISETTSGSDERLYETPLTADFSTAAQIQGLDDGFALDDSQHYFHALPTPDNSRTPTIHRNGNIEHMARRPSTQAGEPSGLTGSVKRSENFNRSAGGLGIQFGEHDMIRPSLKPETNLAEHNSHRIATSTKAEPKSDVVTTRTENPPILSPVREVRTPSPAAKRRAPLAPEAIKNRTDSNKRISCGKMDLRIPPYAELARARQNKQNGSAQKANGATSGHTETARSNHTPHSPKTNYLHESFKSFQFPQGQRQTHNHENEKLNQSTYVLTNNHQPESPKASAYHPQVNGWQQPGKKGKKNKSRPGSTQLLPGEPIPANEAERKGG